MMSLPWEVIAAVADSVIVSLFYMAFKEGRRTVQQLKATPDYKVGKELEEALLIAPDNVLPYVCVSGKVEPRGKGLCSQYHDQKGVIQRLILTELRTKRTHGFWTDFKTIIRNTLNIMPFSMVAEDGSGKTVHVFEPLEADYLMEELQTTYDKFNPNTHSVVERGIDRLFGDVSKGYQETEQMLPVESHIVGFGQLALWRGDMQLMPPGKEYKYILSRLSKAELIKQYESHARAMKRCALVFGALGAAIMVYWLYKKWWQLKERQEADKIIQEIRERRGQTVANTPDKDEEEGGILGMECVICISNPREVILLDCGHICICAECARLLPRPTMCPICRNHVARVQPIYMS